MKYVIRLNGFLQGGFKAHDEDNALNTYAHLEKFADFKDLLNKRSLKRDDFTVEEVKDGG